MNPSDRYDPTVQVILGIPFNNVTFAEAVEWARGRIESRTPGYVTTPNWDFLRLAWGDPELHRILLESHLVVADGMPIVWLSRLFGKPLKERVTGSDLAPLLAEMAAREGRSLFLLGGAPGVGAKAAEALRRRLPGLRIAGHYSPPLADVLSMDHSGILDRLRDAEPDILLIAFGAPKQEKFANLHVRTWNVPVSVGVGGTLDFLAGTQLRAPRLVRKLALEWLWRLLTDPRRLLKRYLAGFGFMLALGWQLLRLRLTPDRPAPADPEESDPSAPEWPEAEWHAGAAATIASPDALFAAAGSRSLVLDLGGAAWLDSTRLGVLLQLARICRRHDRRLVLCRAGTRLTALLKACRLDDYLDLAATRAEARALLAQLTPGILKGRAYRGGAGELVIQAPRDLTAANVAAFKSAIDPLLAQGPAAQPWVVDLQHTRFVDSAALGLFKAWSEAAASSDRAFRIRHASGPVARTFQIARLTGWLESPA